VGTETAINSHHQISSRHQCESCLLRLDCLIAKLLNSNDQNKEQILKNKRSISQGDFLFKAGNKSESIYIVKVGAIKTVKVCPQGAETVLAYHFPGDIVGAASINKGLHHLNAQALSDTRVCELSWDQLTQSTPYGLELSLRISELISNEVNHGYERIIIMSKKQPRSKVAYFLVSYSKRMKSLGLSPTEFNFPVSISELSTYLGLARETVSRQLSALKEKDIVDIQGKSIKIKSYEALAEMAEEIPLERAD
jgi:CRP/FNR family transcriptional regulator, anaerobic regulatory protein